MSTEIADNLIPVSVSMLDGWDLAAPADYNMEVDALLISRASAAYKPTITILRTAGDADLLPDAEATLSELGDEFKLVGREAGEGFIAQRVQFGIEGYSLELAESFVHWESKTPGFASTNVRMRLICESSQIADVLTDFETMLQSLEPDLT